MVVVIEKRYNKKKVNQMMSEFKPVKTFGAKKFAGTIEWGEDPLEYQKRIRNEWN
ncbi:hypothetical protein AGMMS49982_08810 [Bacteroidia bacterium]|nr:hypothetical protein AGMMS49982_08810 [Bacteroidia bacterium]